jgi:biotin carboxylase
MADWAEATAAEWVAGDGVAAVVAASPHQALGAACLARASGVSWHSPSGVELSLDRVRTRLAFFAAGVPHPEYRVVRSGDDVAHLARLVGLPCAVKPAPVLGRVASLRAVDEEDAVGAVHLSRSILRRREHGDVDLVVERCLTGTEIVVIGWVHDSSLDVQVVFDKPDNRQHPHHGDELLATPAALSADQRADVIRSSAAAVSAVGLTEGPVSLDLCVDSRFVRVLELRPYWPESLHAVEIAEGVTFEDLELQCALDAEVASVLRGAVVVLDVVAPSAGELVGVGGRSDAMLVPSVRVVSRLEEEGVRIAPPPESDDPVTRIVCRADSRTLAVEDARTARSCLEVLIRS